MVTGLCHPMRVDSGSGVGVYPTSTVVVRQRRMRVGLSDNMIRDSGTTMGRMRVDSRP